MADKPYRFHPAYLHQGMKMHGENGPVSIDTNQGPVVLMIGDLIIPKDGGKASVMRKRVADQAYGVDGLPSV